MKCEANVELRNDGTLYVVLPRDARIDMRKIERVIVEQTGRLICVVTYADCEDCKYAEKE
jgi:hypothetical protein